MAESDSGQEKTEEPTAKKRQQSRDEGQVPRSRELSTTSVLLGGAVAMLLFGADIVASIVDISVWNMSVEREQLFDPETMAAHIGSSFSHVAGSLGPFLFIMFIASVAGQVATGGFILSGKAFMPKLSRMDPIQGLKRMFSARALMELFKSLLKFLLLASFAILILNLRTNDLLRLGDQTVEEAMVFAAWILAWSFLALAAVTLIIAMIDVPFQLWDHSRKLKMTLQEVKDEHKDTEGKPEVRSRIRRLQMEISQRRMMAEVPKADVVITNPEHFAVALKYDPEQNNAPILLAKGEDFIALKIREVANVHGIHVFEEPPLARAIFHNTEIGQEIPGGLYVAVAQVLAYIFQLRRFRSGLQKKPERPRPPVPDDLRWDPA